jgi:hypothetical protein
VVERLLCKCEALSSPINNNKKIHKRINKREWDVPVPLCVGKTLVLDRSMAAHTPAEEESFLLSWVPGTCRRKPPQRLELDMSVKLRKLDLPLDKKRSVSF